MEILHEYNPFPRNTFPFWKLDPVLLEFSKEIWEVLFSGFSQIRHAVKIFLKREYMEYHLPLLKAVFVSDSLPEEISSITADMK